MTIIAWGSYDESLVSAQPARIHCPMSTDRLSRWGATLCRLGYTARSLCHRPIRVHRCTQFPWAGTGFF